MFGWFNVEAASASRWNRASACGSRATLSGRNFRATKRCRRTSSALYTIPIPPPPSFSILARPWGGILGREPEGVKGGGSQWNAIRRGKISQPFVGGCGTLRPVSGFKGGECDVEFESGRESNTSLHSCCFLYIL